MPGEAVRSIALWCERTFATYTSPCDVVMNPIANLSFEEQGHIMGSYETAVRDMDLIDFDPDLWADSITESALDDLAGRSKPLFATVSGCGRGKTRACTEIRKVLLTKANVFSLSITFNSNWSVKNSTDQWNGMLFSVSFALSIVARMVSMFYGKPLVAVHTKMMRSLPDISELLATKGGDVIIKGFVIFMMTLVRKFRERVDTFVLIVDEVAAIERYFKKKFNKENVTSTLRKVFLENSITVPFLTAPLNVSLFISSLEAAYVGRTCSSRPIRSVLLADKLDENRVADIWVSTLNNNKRKRLVPPMQNVSTFERRALSLVAATLSNIPRLVEFVNDFFRQLDSVQSAIDGKTILDLFATVLKRIEEWYCLKELSLVVDSLLVTVIFHRSVRMDDKDMIAAIRNSLITNTITVYGSEEYLEDYRVSLLMILALTEVKSRPSKFCKVVHNRLSAIVYLLSEFYETAKKTDAGLPLTAEIHQTLPNSTLDEQVNEVLLMEKVVHHWLEIKLAAAITATASPFSFGISLLDVFSLRETDLDISRLLSGYLLVDPLHFYSVIPTVQLNNDSHISEVAFLRELEEVDYGAFPDFIEYVGARENRSDENEFTAVTQGSEWRESRRRIQLHRTRVVIIIPHSGEAWDIGLKIRFPDLDSDFYILIDSKCRREGEISNDTDHKSTIPKITHQAQYKHTCTVMGRRMLDFVYICMSTYEIESRVQGRCILLGKADTAYFLGPVSDLFRALRVLLINK